MSDQKRIITDTSQSTPSPFQKDPPGVIQVRSIQGHTYFLGLREIIPEDLMWRRQNSRVPALVCLQKDNSCDCPYGCVKKMSARCIWLFRRRPKLKQIMICIKREESELQRPLPPFRHTMGMVRPYTVEDMEKGISRYRHERMMREQFEDQFQRKVPRIWIVRIPSNFTEQPQPYTIFRGNYDGLCQALKPSYPEDILVDVSYWSGSF